MPPVIYLNEKHIGRIKKNESGILIAIRDYMRLRGWFVIRIQQGLGSHKGISDLIAVKDGVTIWIEVKTAKGKLSRYQKEFQEQITTSGGIYIVARGPEDVIELEKALPPLCYKEGRNDKENKKKGAW